MFRKLLLKKKKTVDVLAAEAPATQETEEAVVEEKTTEETVTEETTVEMPVVEEPVIETPVEETTADGAYLSSYGKHFRKHQRIHR